MSWFDDEYKELRVLRQTIEDLKKQEASDDSIIEKLRKMEFEYRRRMNYLVESVLDREG